MPAILKTITINPIYETSSEEENEQPKMNMLRRGKEDDTPSEAARRQSRSWFDSNIASKKAGGKDKEKSKKHRSTNSRSSNKEKSRHSTRRNHGSDKEGHSSSSHHRRRSVNSTSDEEEEEEDDDVPQPDQSMALATRKRLTSPSMVSQFTTRTNATNKSSGSSGSNSTVTQSSLTHRSTALVRRPEPDHSPMSPAVPDAPDVFAYLEAASVLDVAIASGSESESGSDSEHDEEEEQNNQARPQWSRANSQSALVHTSQHSHNSSSSSTASSFHGEDDFSSHSVDLDTDRSTSPEHSVKDHDSDHEDDTSDAHSVKIATQMAAAQQRQHLHALASPALQRTNLSVPPTPSSMLTPRFAPGGSQPPRPPCERQPVSPGRAPVASGYELLATQLATRHPDVENGRVLKPIYRKFEFLNHRVLLHLQDELSELEQCLQQIDRADSQARQLERSMIPASRRAAAQAGGDLEWHKTDVLGKIGYKLTQYNQALSSFKETQSLSPPEPEDISTYREYLHTEQPIAEKETHFLDPTDDLVSVCSESNHMRRSHSTQNPSYAPSTYSVDERPSMPSTHPSSSSTSLTTTLDQSNLPGLAAAIAASVVIPILTFSVIDKFLGRLVVASLVASGLVGALMQSGILSRGALFGQEAIMCAAIHGGVMIILAGII